MTVGIGQVKEPLAPLCVARRRGWPKTLVDGTVIERIHVAHVEDHPPPPGPPPLWRRNREVQVARPRLEAAEGCAITPIPQHEAQRAVEPHRPRHVVCRQRDRADRLNWYGGRPAEPRVTVPIHRHSSRPATCCKDSAPPIPG